MGCRNLEWSWPPKAMSIPIWAGFVAGAKASKNCNLVFCADQFFAGVPVGVRCRDCIE